METWSELLAFPGYSVSDLGRVRNDRTGHILRIIVNQLGIAYVGLRKVTIDCKRAVAPLVAHAFLPQHQHLTFDTPIHLDGDRLNIAVENLMWRPRWFAVKYHRQFYLDRMGIQQSVYSVETGEEFDTSWHAATTFGLIDRDLTIAISRDEYIWPTYQKFRIVGKRY